MFENAQIEVPGWGGLGGGLCAPSTPQKGCLTRLATQGRGGFKRIRAFRRAKVDDAMCREMWAEGHGCSVAEGKWPWK